MTSIGESLLEEFNPKTALSMDKLPKKRTPKKHGQILHFERFLKENIDKEMTIVDVGSGVVSFYFIILNNKSLANHN